MDTIIPRVGAIVMINVGSLRLAPIKRIGSQQHLQQSISTIQSGLATPAVVGKQANKHADMFCGLQLLNVIIGFAYTI